MATRRTPEGLRFDHGAQYFTAQDERFVRQVETWEQLGLVSPWTARIGSLERGRVQFGSPQTRYVAVPGMNGICKHLAAGLDVHWETRVRPPQREDGCWQLASDSGLSLGGWDFVAISAPAPQAASLLAATPGLAAAARSVDLVGCWAALLALDVPLDVDFDAAFVQQSPLSWIARNNSKPGRNGDAEAWVLHATPDWTATRIEEPPENVLPDLLEALWEAAGRTPQRPALRGRASLALRSAAGSVGCGLPVRCPPGHRRLRRLVPGLARGGSLSQRHGVGRADPGPRGRMTAAVLHTRAGQSPRLATGLGEMGPRGKDRPRGPAAQTVQGPR